MHLRALQAGRHIDLWPVWVYQSFGGPVLLFTLSIPMLLRRQPRRSRGPGKLHGPRRHQQVIDWRVFSAGGQRAGARVSGLNGWLGESA